MNLFKLTGAVMILSLLSLISCGKAESAFDDCDLIPVKTSKDGKWSMVNQKGEIVYDAEFKEQPTIAYNSLFSVEEDDGYTVYRIGDKSPKIVSGLEGLKSVGVLKDGLMPVTFKNSRITIVDKEGKKKFELEPVKGKEIISCNPTFSEGLLTFQTDDERYGYYSAKGKVAIDPKYDVASDFLEGLAVVGQRKDKDSYEIDYSVIDTDGKTVFKIKEGYTLETRIFKNGYIIAEKDDRLYLINKKGEETKLPSQVSSVSDYNDKFIIFSNDGEYGIADIKGEIIVRAKYEELAFNTDNSFFALKDSKDKEVALLNSKGDEEKKLDYEALFNMGKFGYLAKEGKTFLLLNDKFEKKGKEEFFDINLNIASTYSVTSDYFSTTGVAGVMVGMIQGNKVCGFTLGAKAASVLSGNEPRNYSYKSSANIETAKVNGFRYSISAQANFTASIADSSWDSYNYSYNYYWNPNSELGEVLIEMSTSSDWGKDGAKAIKDALIKADFKLVKEDGNNALFRKGQVLVMAESNSSSCQLGVFDGTIKISGRDIESYLKSQLAGGSDDDEAVAVEEAAEVADIPAATE